ncbi:MAG: class I SAM-dependent methyltransferase, partial [Gammaproteobacteria bacterium]|nr:class I SAM-dependent methyltransferase [Gammaproteobacteria bacterium]
SMLRILKPGGRLVVLEFSHPENPLLRTAYNAFSNLWPGIGKMVTGDKDSYQYLVDSIKVHPEQGKLKEMFVDAGYVNCKYHNLLNGIVAIHTGKKMFENARP